MSTEKPDCSNNRTQIQVFIEKNLRQLAQEVIYWRRRGKLPEGAIFTELAALCEPEASIGDEYQIAEQYIVKHLLNQAAGLD